MMLMLLMLIYHCDIDVVHTDILLPILLILIGCYTHHSISISQLATPYRLRRSSNSALDFSDRDFSFVSIFLGGLKNVITRYLPSILYPCNCLCASWASDTSSYTTNAFPLVSVESPL